MMVKTLPSTLALVIALTVQGADAQTIADEQLKITQYEQQLQTLGQNNKDIDRQLAELDRQISKLAGKSAPEEQVRDAAEARYQAALKAAEDKPSLPNKERAEAARFEFLMADRKYQRASQDVKKLRKQQDSLRAKQQSNQKKMRSANAGIAEQQQAILALEQQARQQAAQQAQSERQLRLKQEGVLRNNQGELDRAREEHAAAMAEIAALKAALASKEAAAAAAASLPPITTVATLQAPDTVATDTDGNTDQAVTAPVDSVRGDRDQYFALLASAESATGSRHRVNKILHVKTYRKDRLSKQTSHSLKHMGNGIYQGKTVVRAGETTFVIGSKQWDKTIPASDHKQRFVFVLDARDKSNPELLLFARSDIE